ncbi:hypothetical protein M9458_046614, partial [Cirrhinus mrigala]
WSSRGLCRFHGVDTGEARIPIHRLATPDPGPSPPSPCCVESMSKPTADREPEPAATNEPSPHGVTDPQIAAESELLPATTPTTREKAMASDIVEGSSAHGNMAEGELVEDLGL